MRQANTSIIKKIESSFIAALAGATGALLGAGVAAAVSVFTHRENLAQRNREHIVMQAYQAAATEYKTGIEAATKLHEDGRFQAASYSSYLVYHITLAELLIDRKRVVQLDPAAITRALDEAKRLSMATGKANGIARGKT